MKDKIDFVLPWVDGNDEEWRKIRKQFMPVQKDVQDSHSEARYRDMETLKYVLRSIEKNCPWYHKIYLISTGHYPEWLDINNPKIKLVTHEDLYFNKDHLPTFNSGSIEMNLPNLKELSEKFVYLNDDMVIMQKLNIERFFVNNLPVDFLSHGWIPRNNFVGRFKHFDSWVHSLNNILKLINTRLSPKDLEKYFLYHESYPFVNKLSNFFLKNIYKKYFWFEHWHHPQAILKNTLTEVYDEFQNEMMVASKNRFRSNYDLYQYIYRYWQLATGNFVPFKFDDALVSNLDSLSVLDKLINKINSKNINFVCFNDSVHLPEEEYAKVKSKLNQFLEDRFPEKASFEL
jgi:hypothetical protein